ncbi:MAG: hypothetical protein FJW79_11070 [Actinobacteria bacterium]|nr:hypothetical protein [Actinomycetota bacterium]
MRSRRRRALVACGMLLAIGLPATAQPAARTFTVAATGDLIIHQAIAVAARGQALSPGGYDFGPLLEPIEPWIADADFAICHLEGTLSPTNTGLLYQHEEEHPAYFNGPREVAVALAAAGYDACSTAGNHALDRGLTGVRETLEVLDAAGLGHSGTARSPDERLPALYEVNGVQVAHLAYTLGTNQPRPYESPWALNLLEATSVLADGRWAREQGADFTIVSLHWGTEYQSALDPTQTRLAEALTASPDVDLILGHHTHLVQAVARVNGKVVVYGMGNLLSNIRTGLDGAKAGAEDGVIVHLTVTEQPGQGFAVTDLAVTATWVNPDTKEVLPVEHTLAHGDPAVWTAALQVSAARTYRRLGGRETGIFTVTPTPWPSLLCSGRVATIIGTAGPDLLVGTPGDDVIVGRGGDDLILGLDGDDLICGGAGHDTIWGGPGHDHLWGGPGNDLLSGGAGPDRLYGEEGDDRLGGGPGDDALFGGPGNDTLSGHGGDDLLVAGPGNDLLHGGTGQDLLVGFDAADRLLGDPGDSCRWAAVAAACG